MTYDLLGYKSIKTTPSKLHPILAIKKRKRGGREEIQMIEDIRTDLGKTALQQQRIIPRRDVSAVTGKVAIFQDVLA
jgi:hypothetical protein